MTVTAMQSRDLTGFITLDGRMMSQILSGLDGVQCYLDDIIVYADTPTLHETWLKARKLDNSGLRLNMEKCLNRHNN